MDSESQVTLWSHNLRPNLLRHYKMRENFDSENHLQVQFFSPLLNLLNPQSFQTTMSEGGGLEKHFSELARFSLEGKSINHTVIPFVSTTSVCDYSAYFQFLKHLGHFIATSPPPSPIPLPTPLSHPPSPLPTRLPYHMVRIPGLECSLSQGH